MARKFYTCIIVPDASQQLHKLRIPVKALYVLAIIGAISFFTAVGLSFNYIGMASRAAGYQSLEEENAKLKIDTRQARLSATKLSRQVTALENEAENINKALASDPLFKNLVKSTGSVGGSKTDVSTTELEPKKLIKKIKDSPDMVGADWVKAVTTKEPYDFGETLLPGYEWPDKVAPKDRQYFVVAIDGGIKRNILRKLNQHGFRVRVVPATTKAEEILALKPNGVFLSNGPGDPAAVTYLVETTRKLIGKVPVFGICLGHQILGLALGGKTYKLKFGHRGGNHPVMDLFTRKIEITSQNHGFAVDVDSLPKEEVELTHINLNDKTAEGLRHKKHPVFSV